MPPLKLDQEFELRWKIWYLLLFRFPLSPAGL